MGFFLTAFILISIVFAFLAWRMDRKHKTSYVVDGRRGGAMDKQVAEAVFGDDRWDRQRH
ncbi:hypothetical protein JCM18899A_42010 [Nocardioides sp. AN3]